MESWLGYCREERASKVLEVVEQSTESAELNILFTEEKLKRKILPLVPDLMPAKTRGASESFGPENDFFGRGIRKCPLHPVATDWVV